MNKFEKFNNEIKTYFRSEVVTNLSPSTSHRSRCEFSYYDNHYAMHGPNKKLLLKSFPSAASCIKKVMPRLIKEINNSSELNERLFQINFRSNKDNKVMVTLIYHKKINESLIALINNLSKKYDLLLIARSKNFVYSTNQMYLDNLIDGYINYQTDNCFIEKVSKMVINPKDLLEIYCGVGTFTLSLSKIFSKVFATENNRSAIKCLKKAMNENQIHNIMHARLSAEEVCDAFHGKKFFRLNEIDINNLSKKYDLLLIARSKNFVYSTNQMYLDNLIDGYINYQTDNCFYSIQSIKSLFLSGLSEKLEQTESMQKSEGLNLPESKLPPTATFKIK